MPLFRRSKDPAPEPERVVPSVDLDVPVTNPELLEAIRTFATERTPANERLMQQAFNRAVFLATADFSESTMAPAPSGGPSRASSSRPPT